MTKVDLRLYALIDPEHVGVRTHAELARRLRKAARRWSSCATSVGETRVMLERARAVKKRSRHSAFPC